MTDTFIKDPSDRMDYQVNWSEWLGADTISAVTWTVPSGITNHSTSTTTTTATIWLEGGSANNDYEIPCKVTTAGGRIKERTLKIQVREQ